MLETQALFKSLRLNTLATAIKLTMFFLKKKGRLTKFRYQTLHRLPPFVSKEVSVSKLQR